MSLYSLYHPYLHLLMSSQTTAPSLPHTPAVAKTSPNASVPDLHNLYVLVPPPSILQYLLILVNFIYRSYSLPQPCLLLNLKKEEPGAYHTTMAVTTVLFKKIINLGNN